MSNRIERLRFWLLASAALLVLVIAGYIGYARLLRHWNLSRLPGKLGVDVVEDANGWTYAHSVGSKTTYVLHAAKRVGYKDGKVQLHDVWMVLYGKDGSRNDRISGSDFEYDEKAGVVRAMGLVHIDLQAAPNPTHRDGTAMNGPLAASGASGANGVSDATPASVPAPATGKVLHVTTSGLVYIDKLGVAATNEYIEFQGGQMTGHATGADYSSDSGMLLLHSAVNLSGFASGRPVNMTAATASFDQRSQEAYLTHATYESEGRRAEAQQATLHRRADGTLSRIEAQGNVTVSAVDKGSMVSQKADVALNGTSQPESAVLTGGVLYTVDEPLRQVRGKSQEATITWDKQANPQPQNAVFTGAVEVVERTRTTESVRELWSVRDLTAERLDAVLGAGGKGTSQLKSVEATGNARLAVVDNGSLANAKSVGRTELSGDDLRAVMTAPVGVSKQPSLDTLAARGHTVLHQVDAKGVEQTSTGDTLDAKFRPKDVGSAAAKSGKQGSPSETLASAVQQGHVTLMRRTPAKGGLNTGDDVQHGVAQRAVYDGDTDRVTLTGGVQLAQAGSTVWANQVALDRASGDSQAVGAVKVDYVQNAAGRDGAGAARGALASGTQQGSEPMHILAERAELEHATGIATFHGKPVRLWQAGSQVQAPVIEIAQQQQRLIARSEAGTGWSSAVQQAQVRTVLSGGGSPGAGGAQGSGKGGVVACAAAKTGTAGASAGGAAAGTNGAGAIRIASGGLVYSGILRQANFTGGVRADTDDAMVRGNEATAYLLPSDVVPQKDAASAPSLAGRLDRVVTAGHVNVERPGMQATGEKLLYTASDRMFVLTGSAAVPPKAMGAQGATTAAALRFNSCDDSVEALGQVPGGASQGVHTEAHVNDEKKAGR